MYADDTSLTTCGTSQKSLFDEVNADISGICNWLKANKLSLNSAKTEHMFIASDDKLRKIIPEPHIYLDNEPVITLICKKISSVLGGIRQVRDCIPLETAITIYKSLVLPWFDYCDVVWDNLPATSAERLRQKMQNRAARILTKSSYDTRSSDILASLGWVRLQRSQKRT